MLQKETEFSVLLIFLLRYDYVSRMKKSVLPTINKLIDSGVHAEYMQPIFPSTSSAAHMSLVTGLYAESHGILGNKFYSLTRNAKYEMSYKKDEWWTDAIPFWITALQAGIPARTGGSLALGQGITFAGPRNKGLPG